MFKNFIQYLQENSDKNEFSESSNQIDRYILSLSYPDFIQLLEHIGIIPESIEHDSSMEKLFSKASDSILSRAFKELGLQSSVLDARSDSADVIAKSYFHEYSLVADAKAFRLSRTAKNQKDFKVEALSKWRKDNNYAILASPYFQYPNKISQIYKQAQDNNVCLLGWEHLCFLIKNGIKEDEKLNLSNLWSFSEKYSQTCTVAHSKAYFIDKFDIYFCELLKLEHSEFEKFLNTQINIIKDRGRTEKEFLQSEEKLIKKYSREEAIKELLKAKKIDSKIQQIDKYIQRLDL
ncbi:MULTISPECIES: HindIII family type II restriction endonuclease [unclassified Pasteurella]|uniref:HindIII family type II restriction endonuclease n=1 Tax=unclassified Pasteurella TaxID=2621516 RepID=UPI001073462F|nr:HindIII family type II restriction endonuclease [Pasteurella sp. 19428wF3_WM03]TFU52609.1 HindIII family type II restriction endonuclease [Pasteurella sp. WM03]